MYLYDISNPSSTTIYGYFDTQPQTGTTNYSGNWGAYPYLPSKIIIACDMQNGIFILEGDNTYQGSVGIGEQSSQSSMFSVYPNPAKDEIHFLIANQSHKNIQCTITDVLGKIVYTESLNINEAFYKTTIHTSVLNNGCYFVTLKGNNLNETKKILIQK